MDDMGSISAKPKGRYTINKIKFNNSTAVFLQSDN